jgi:fumarate hydratase class II
VQASQLELNVMMPMIAYNLLFSIDILTNGINAFTEKCIKGIRANVKRCKEFAEATLAIATALNPVIGYSAAAETAKEALRTGKNIKDVVIEKGILNRNEAERILNPERLTGKRAS